MVKNFLKQQFKEFTVAYELLWSGFWNINNKNIFLSMLNVENFW